MPILVCIYSILILEDVKSRTQGKHKKELGNEQDMCKSYKRWRILKELCFSCYVRNIRSPAGADFRAIKVNDLEAKVLNFKNSFVM